MNAFGAKIIATEVRDVNVPDYVTMASFLDIITQSDIISIHCPADGNINLIGEKEFAAMKDGAIIINVSRGGIINEAALDKALASGKLAGCGLDVAAKEPLPKDHPLLRHDNVTVSPHMAWYSEESAIELKRKVAQEAVSFANGQPVRYSVLK
jgi:D-3-phosphoglycerate dehydrogenase